MPKQIDGLHVPTVAPRAKVILNDVLNYKPKNLN